MMFSEGKLTMLTPEQLPGVSRITCQTNQYLSRLAYTRDPEEAAYDWYIWYNNLSVGYIKKESHCWMSTTTLAQSSNGSLALAGERVIIEGIDLLYLQDSYISTTWSFTFCLVLNGTVVLHYVYSCGKGIAVILS